MCVQCPALRLATERVEASRSIGWMRAVATQPSQIPETSIPSQVEAADAVEVSETVKVGQQGQFEYPQAGQLRYMLEATQLLHGRQVLPGASR